MLTRHKQALTVYRNQDWDSAEREFFALQQANPGRALYAMYLDRVAYFKNHPPAPAGMECSPSRRSSLSATPFCYTKAQPRSAALVPRRRPAPRSSWLAARALRASRHGRIRLKLLHER